MVHAAKALAIQMTNPEKAGDWRRKNNLVSHVSHLNFHLSRALLACGLSPFGISPNCLANNCSAQRFCFLFDCCKERALVRRQMSDKMAKDVFFDLLSIAVLLEKCRCRCCRRRGFCRYTRAEKHS